jgi:hypothetical protein
MSEPTIDQIAADARAADEAARALLGTATDLLFECWAEVHAQQAHRLVEEGDDATG